MNWGTVRVHVQIRTNRGFADLLRRPAFFGLYTSSCLMVLAGSMSNLALAALIFTATGSPLLTAFGLFGSSLASTLGSATIMSAADSLRPRIVLSAMPAIAVVILLVHTADIPVYSRLVLELVAGFLFSVGSGARWGLLTEILPERQYVLGRALFGMTFSTVQIVGFLFGGALLLRLVPTTVFYISAGLCAVAVVISVILLPDIPARSSERVGLRSTWRRNGMLLQSAERRALLTAIWVPIGLVVGCEGIFYALYDDGAPWLFACGAAGMFVGDLAVGRLLDDERRLRFLTLLRFLNAAPYALFLFDPPLSVACLVVFVACLGVSAALPLQELMLWRTPKNAAGQLLGLNSAGVTTFQAVGAALAGGMAEIVTPPTAMVVAALMAVGVSFFLTPSLRRTKDAFRSAEGVSSGRLTPRSE